MPKRVPTHRSPHAAAVRDQFRRQYERTAARQEDWAFYHTPAWRKLRAHILAERPLCVDCQKVGRLTPADHVHHVIERKDRPDLALEETNLEPVCRACHNRKREGGTRNASA